MSSPNFTNRYAVQAIAWIAGLTFLCGLIFPVSVEAAPPRQEYEGPEKCAECHYAEAQQWNDSGHAHALIDAERSLQLACAGEGGYVDCACLECHTTDYDPNQGTYAHGGVTCEVCHGAYIEDHPVDGSMVLTSDSELCQSCHVDTHGQWASSPHGDADVGCTSCHTVHSQDLRLSDKVLCDSCHRDQYLGPVHNAHVGRGADCVDCHLSHDYQPQMPAGAESQVMAVMDRPNIASHTFAVSTTRACVSCHAEGAGLQQVVYSDAVTERASQLALELDTVLDENRKLQTMSVVTLGVGLGVGIFLGAVFVLAIGFVYQGRSRQ